jgi:hypothetical protein
MTTALPVRRGARIAGVVVMRRTAMGRLVDSLIATSVMVMRGGLRRRVHIKAGNASIARYEQLFG